MNAAVYQGGENFNLRDVLAAGRSMRMEERAVFFGGFLSSLTARNESLYMREIGSAAGREVLVADPITGDRRRMLMFGSNNYLGLADHPYVKERVIDAVQRYGAGIGGPPLLNGHTELHAELERRIAAFKHAEDAILFSSGYSANIGLIAALATKHDTIIYDEFSHASLWDGITMSRARSFSFAHNDIGALEALLRTRAHADRDTYVCVEGVYSMDGDRAPLETIAPLCREHGAHLILDDAHGTGVVGEHGCGTAEACGVRDGIDFTMGTFSKAFAAVGGFVAGPSSSITYLRFFARSHMFSASLPPSVVAAVLAGLDILECDAERIDRLWSNIRYAVRSFHDVGIDVRTDSAIIALHAPPWMAIRKAACEFHRAGIFLNSIEYPAVPVHQQRFRISLMATHTKEDIDRLVACTADVWRSADVRTVSEERESTS